MKKLGSMPLVVLLVLAIGLVVRPPTVAAQEQQASAQSLEAVPHEAPRQIEVTILGMSCPFCVYGIEQKMKSLEGVEALEVDLETGIATLTMEEGADVSNEELDRRVKKAGFEVAKITRNYESDHPEYDAGEKG